MGIKRASKALAHSNSILGASLAIFPSAGLMAFIAGEGLILLVLALFVPFALIVSVILKAKSSSGAIDSNGQIAKVDLVGELDRHISVSDRPNKCACLIFEVDDISKLQKKVEPTAFDFLHDAVAERIEDVLRNSDIIFDLAAGRFGVCMPNVRTPELGSILQLAARVQDSINLPIPLDRSNIFLTASVGFCIETRAAKPGGKELYRSALLALAEAKRNGPSGIRSYSAKTPENGAREVAIFEDLDHALKNGDIKPWFQPQISTDTGQVTGFEALARWVHPKHGVILPMEFLPLLEGANRLEELSERILDQALRALVEWDRLGLKVPSVSVNFATQELRNPGLVDRIKWDVDRYNLEPERLIVEILETVISESEDDVVTRNIRALGAQGFMIDLDDFGTGHASLSNIRRFAVDRIKIDRAFVTNVDNDPEQRRMIAAIVGMAERLEIETLAEGVERTEEQSILSQLGCTHLQGFSIARPMPFEETRTWLQNRMEEIQNPVFFSRNTR